MSEVSIELDGRTYTGQVNVENGRVFVSTPYGLKSTQIGSNLPESVARMMLRDLVLAEKARKDSML